MRVRAAGSADLAAVVALLDDAAGWLRRRRIRQWPEAFSAEWVAPAVAAGEVHLAFDGDLPVGTFALTWADPTVWGPLDGGDAGYVHQLAVARARAGHGIGRALLEHAGRLVAGQGRRWVRLDCVAHNRRLRSYYEGLGFVHCGDVPAAQRGVSASRYQRPAV